MDFGIFQSLTDYGVLGFAVLALGYLVWHFLQKLMKSEEEYRNKFEELEEQYRSSLEKKLDESTDSSKSLKDTVLSLLSRKI
jgi:Tfp pilus assembly protein PilO